MKFILAIDQGTTGSTALVLAPTGETIARANVEFPQHFPKPGWVEHDGGEIWSSVERSVKGALESARIDGAQIAAIGITNQRETTLVWDKKTGDPIHRAIVWQCRRTAETCESLRSAGHADTFRDRTGLVLDAYFSGTKIAWILDHVEGARKRAELGELAFGTIDSFLVNKLTAGDRHVIDVTNASRTLLMDLRTRTWDAGLAAILRVPMAMLPTIVPSAGNHGTTKGVGFLPDGIPIAGIAGDQQAALFGQACFSTGDAKCTYGTGAFVLVNVGDAAVISRAGLVGTVAWQIGDRAVYALEGSSFIAGAAVQWLRDGLGLIGKAQEIEALARSVPSSDGVAFVPALAGLGAPHWDPRARGTITGITRGTTKAHLARATLEGIAFSVNDLLMAMARDAGRPLGRLRVDGGACANDLLMQFQADVANVAVERPKDVESTARGAAMLAAVGAGILPPPDGQGAEQLRSFVKDDRTFSPSMGGSERQARLEGWQAAIRGTLAVAHSH